MTSDNPNEIIKKLYTYIYMLFIYICDFDEQKHLHKEYTQVEIEREDIYQGLMITFLRTWLFRKYKKMFTGMRAPIGKTSKIPTVFAF